MVSDENATAMGSITGKSEARRHARLPWVPAEPTWKKSDNVYLVIGINLWTLIDMDDTSWQSKNRIYHNYKSFMIDVDGMFWITSS